QSNSMAVFMVEANYELENNTGHDGSPSTTGEPGNSCRQAETATEPATGSSSWKCRASPCSGSGPPAARRLQGLNIGLLSATPARACRQGSGGGPLEPGQTSVPRMDFENSVESVGHSLLNRSTGKRAAFLPAGGKR